MQGTVARQGVEDAPLPPPLLAIAPQAAVFARLCTNHLTIPTMQKVVNWRTNGGSSCVRKYYDLTYESQGVCIFGELKKMDSS